MDEVKLTRKQKVFIEKYLECWNATRAATEAGYGHPGPAGARMLARADVKAAIAARMKEMAMPADEVLKRLAEQAALNPADFFIFTTEPSGKVTTEINWAEFKRRGHLVKGLEWSRTGQPVLKFHDAQAALGLIGKSQALFVEKVDSTEHVEVAEVNIYLPDNGRGDSDNG